VSRFVNISVLFFCLLASFSGIAQLKPQDACRVDGDRLVFMLDLKWTTAQKAEVVQLFDLDSALMAGVWSGKTEMTVKGEDWSVQKKSDRIVVLSKGLVSSSSSSASSKGNPDVILIDDQMGGITMESTRESVPYGVNKFTRFNVFRYSGGVARFYLPGHQDANRVVLSGTFNNWSTLEMPMQRTDSGWIGQLKLKPGKYQYKYILDGRWTRDPFNRQGENDLNGGNNSVVFCYNYWFRLAGHNNARNVAVAGSFNNWNRDELKMVRTRSGWMIQLYLREGTHAYKFLVDGSWILDPACRINRPDGEGNMNSFLGIGDTMVFTLKGFPDAKSVFIAGNFNGWNKAELLMEKTAGGWRLPYAMAPGMYEYKFVVDGKWITDPSNPVHTDQGDMSNSLLVFQPNHVFTLDGYSDAKKVTVAGSFNGWNRNTYIMSHKDFKWVFPVRLKPGKYTYKFVVDNKWIRDPANELWEENEYGTGNSVIWVEPGK
jgi:hypothetical protein